MLFYGKNLAKCVNNTGDHEYITSDHENNTGDHEYITSDHENNTGDHEKKLFEKQIKIVDHILFF
jgi:hypothetical protein